MLHLQIHSHCISQGLRRSQDFLGISQNHPNHPPPTKYPNILCVNVLEEGEKAIFTVCVGGRGGGLYCKKLCFSFQFSFICKQFVQLLFLGIIFNNICTQISWPCGGKGLLWMLAENVKKNKPETNEKKNLTCKRGFSMLVFAFLVMGF